MPEKTLVASGWSVMVACNNPRNGTFAGRADSFDLISPDGDIALSFTSDDGTAVKFSAGRNWIRLGGPGRREYRILKSRNWSGNWCWNQYWLTDAGAVRLVRSLWKRFGTDMGWSDLIDRLYGGEAITAELLNDIANGG